MRKIGIALLGLGTVGGGTYRILMKNHQMLLKNNGVDLEIRHIIERDRKKAENLGVDMNIVSDNIDDVVNDKDTQIVVEFFGGIEPAKSFLIKCLLAGKSIVTANKEMFSKSWVDLEKAAKKGKAGLYFEASCMGGVPIIRTLTDGMQGNNILALKGIVNGTTNYILSNMEKEGRGYAEVLKEAQDLGYAEANPSADVDGFDSMYKLSILSSLAFRTKVPISKIYREGISKVEKIDLEVGKYLGYTLKLLAIAKIVDGKVEARVHPTFVSESSTLASVSQSYNAISIIGDNVGEIMLYGKGAGDLPTGSAIVSDIVYAATKKKPSYVPFKNTDNVNDSKFNNDFKCEYYLRLNKKDQNVLLKNLLKHNIEIKNITHKNDYSIIMTGVCPQSKLDKSISGIEGLVMYRMEE